MEDMRQPDHLSWDITADTVFQKERAMKELDGDWWRIEVQADDGKWEAYSGGDLRLTCSRGQEEED